MIKSNNHLLYIDKYFLSKKGGNMIDNRIHTFLELCTVMNYHKTAYNLNMTQPAVTQHIKYLEHLYDCKLFTYSNKKLQKTEKCFILEKYARSMIALNLSASEELSVIKKTKINIGATKTIGEYKIDSTLPSLLSNEHYEVNIIIDNTKHLLDQLDHFDLDLLMLEGFVDKEKYNCRKITTEEIIGVCSKEHPFANREVELTSIFSESIVLREQGSGTRAVFEQFLTTQGYSIHMFKKRSIISSNRLIECSIMSNLAISFLYESIPQKNKNLATFKIKGSKILHDFNYVFINNKKSEEIMKLLQL